MPTNTGIFTTEEAKGHLFSYRLAQFIGKKLPKNQPIYDYGCGPGAYLRYLIDIGFSHVQGVEGTEEQEWEVNRSLILCKDLTKELTLDRIQGNVICLEVAEHIPEEFEAVFLKNITSEVAKNCFVIMSWAVPGQEGTGHVNCKPNEYVVAKMFEHGFSYMLEETLEARRVVEGHLSYFKETILIFKKIQSI